MAVLSLDLGYLSCGSCLGLHMCLFGFGWGNKPKGTNVGTTVASQLSQVVQGGALGHQKQQQGDEQNRRGAVASGNIMEVDR